MILYHGSNCEIREVDLSVSKVGKDFGCGFYLSFDKNQAQEMAEKKTEQLGEGRPVLNVYEFDEKCLEDTLLKVLRFDSYSRDWAEFVLQNRRNRTRKQMHPYDIVIGPIANDAVGFQIRRYVSGLIDLEKFLTELKYMGGITMQYFFWYRKGSSIFEKNRCAMTKETFMIEEISKDIVLLLMEEHQMDMLQALHVLYTSDTYARLMNPATGLYTQSTAYVYEYLERELATGKMA